MSYEIGHHTKRFWVIFYSLWIHNVEDRKFLPKPKWFEIEWYGNAKVFCFTINLLYLGFTVIYRKKLNV